MKYFKLKDLALQEKPHKDGYEAVLVKDTINGIGFYKLVKTRKQVEKETLQSNLKETNEKIVECFEWFMGKMLNYKTITDLPKLFDYSDFPYNLKDILKERQETREKIRALNGESEE